ncbi:hypothetical protein ACQKD9_11940 [Bacillus paramycoides]|uniref:hypothetical protein n=1 Tax=Bacillus paramycoides TaxID=2026194 RepID=UPI003D0030B1
MALEWGNALIFLGTFAGALAPASIAQYVSHRLTLKREDEKYQKERYRNFYAPLAYKINHYVMAEAKKLEQKLIDGEAIRKHREGVIASGSITIFPLPDADDIFGKVLALIEDNLQYANFQFIEMYERNRMKEIQSEDVAQDGLTDLKWKIRLTENLLVCETFLTEYLSFNEKVFVLPKEAKNEINQILTSVKLYNMMSQFKFYGTANLLFSCTGNYRGVFTDFPDMHQEIDSIKREVNSKIELMIKSTGKDDIDCYEELIDLARSIQNHINQHENHWHVFRYSSALGDAINADISNKKQLIEQHR